MQCHNTVNIMQNYDFAATICFNPTTIFTPLFLSGPTIMKYLYATAFIFMSFHITALPDNHMNDFVNLFDQYCYSFKDKPKSSQHAYLEKQGHKINPDYDAYEILIDGIDYAITPQYRDCTTDVLLKHQNSILFTLDQIDSLLKQRFKLNQVSSRSFTDVALNNQNTLIQQRDYTDGEGLSFRLLYPSDNQDSYYMTFTIEWLDS